MLEEGQGLFEHRSAPDVVALVSLQESDIDEGPAPAPRVPQLATDGETFLEQRARFGIVPLLAGQPASRVQGLGA